MTHSAVDYALVEGAFVIFASGRNQQHMDQSSAYITVTQYIDTLKVRIIPALTLLKLVFPVDRTAVSAQGFPLPSCNVIFITLYL